MTRPGTAPWRDSQAGRLLAFGRGSELAEGGFGWLDEQGAVDQHQPRPLYLSSRMTYVYSLAFLAGDDDALRPAASGIASIAARYADRRHGGWYASLDARNRVSDTTKMNYAHALTLLGTASALAAGVPGAAEVFAHTAATITARFWSDAEGCAVENWDESFIELEPYRGANSNMHSLEAYLVAADVTGDPVWRQRGLSIATKLIDGYARADGWRVPEHYDASWRPLPEYNRDRPTDQFRPFGTTPGHSFEWSRLLLALEGSLTGAPDWLLEAAVGLFDTAVAHGWAADGRPGFVYTVDLDGGPVVTNRLHWVVCEAVLAADTLYRRTGQQRFADFAAQWWQHIADHFLDPVNGGWWHELGPDLTPARSMWPGKPDLYHAYQALLFPSLPLAPSAGVALAANRPGSAGRQGDRGRP